MSMVDGDHTASTRTCRISKLARLFAQTVQQLAAVTGILACGMEVPRGASVCLEMPTVLIDRSSFLSHPELSSHPPTSSCQKMQSC